MAKLILSLDGTVMKEVPLDKERLTIGRRPSNDLQIDNLAVSGEHALIVTILNDSFLEDLGSTNGTLVNGVPIKKHILQHNDVVEIGKYKLKYLAENLATGAHTAAAADYEKTMVIRPAAASRAAESGAGKGFGASQVGVTSTQTGPLGHAVAGATTGPGPYSAHAAAAQRPAVPPAAAPSAAVAPRPPTGPQTGPQPIVARAAATQTSVPPMAPAAAGPLMGAIQILTGPSAGKELDLVKNLTTLGKPGVQVAVITRRPQGYYITHVEGANFPIINGKTLDAQAHPLRDHDVVELAGVKMEFFHRGG
ncbi:MAG: FHA domain-containing protein [Burkholderiales bacterium]|nr:FHA domain-containing protein [Burkholderiales bacterium]